MSLNSCFLRDIDSSTLTTVELSRNLVRSLAEHSLSLTLSLSPQRLPVAGFQTDTGRIENSACCWCCGLRAAEFSLVALGDEIHGEIGFALFSVGVNCLRNLRVVVDIFFGLMTCAGVRVGHWAKPGKTRQSRAHWGWRCRYGSRNCHRRSRGRRTGKRKIDMTEWKQQRRWMNHEWMWIFCSRHRWHNTWANACAL